MTTVLRGHRTPPPSDCLARWRSAEHQLAEFDEAARRIGDDVIATRVELRRVGLQIGEVGAFVAPPTRTRSVAP